MIENKKIFPVINKRLLLVSLILLVALVKTTYSQNCEISIDTDIPVCKYQVFELSVAECDTCTFEWRQDGEIIGGSTNSVLASITDQTLFTVKITYENAAPCESDPFLVTTHPDINIELEQLQLTCSNGDNENGNNAMVKATASGFFEADEYHYFWDVKPIQVAPGDSTIALGLKANQNYSITVKDNYGCFETDTILTEAYKNPDIEIFADPDTAFVQKPDVEFSFINHSGDTIPLSNFNWNFGDCSDEYPDDPCHDDLNKFVENPIHRYDKLTDADIEDGGKEYTVIFTAINEQGCDTLFTHAVKVVPMKLFIPNVFTPNGDGVNDVFRITEPQSTQGANGEESLKAKDAGGFYTPNHYYETTKLVVFNRHGKVLFRDEDYQNDWDGDNLPDGVYYYVLKATGPKGTDIYKGSVTIIRGQ